MKHYRVLIVLSILLAGCSLQKPDDCTEHQTKCGKDMLSSDLLYYCHMGSWQQLSCGSQACNSEQGICEAAEYPRCSGDENRCIESNGMVVELNCVNDHWFPVMCSDSICSGDRCEPVNACNEGDLGHCLDLGTEIGLMEVSCKENHWTTRYCDKTEVCENRRCIVPVSELENDELTCGDHKDNDHDGKTDCDDEECAVLDMCQTDACPDDDNKTEPGLCGCGKADSDADTDGDGTPDCIDACPEDNRKTEPGLCGCGKVDSDVDTDGDDTPDCIDACPEDYRKIAVGTNGCGKLDKKGSDTDGTTFHIYTAEGILDYQALSESDRNKYTKVVFHGEINLDDAGKTVMGTEEVNIPGKPGQKETVSVCNWSEWVPVEVPNGLEITGESAKIVFNHRGMRCRIPKSLFGNMTDVNLHDVIFDLDGKGDFAGLLSDEMADSIISNIQYKGSMTEVGKGWRFGLIGYGKGIQISGVSIEIESMLGDIYVGGLLGEVDDGTIDNKITGLRNHVGSLTASRVNVGGVIGVVSGKLYMENIYNKVGTIYGSDGCVGGLIGDAKEIIIKDVYNEVDELSSYRESGTLIGSAAQITATNIMSFCRSRDLGGASGYETNAGFIGGLSSNLLSKPNLSFENIVSIVPRTKAGFISYMSYKDGVVYPKMKNVISVMTDFDKCENISACDYGAAVFRTEGTGVCTESSNVYYYLPSTDMKLSAVGFSGESYSCLKTYNTGTEAEAIVKSFKQSSDLDWQVKKIEVGDIKVSIPVFTAAGVLLSD